MICEIEGLLCKLISCVWGREAGNHAYPNVGQRNTIQSLASGYYERMSTSTQFRRPECIRAWTTHLLAAKSTPETAEQRPGGDRTKLVGGDGIDQVKLFIFNLREWFNVSWRHTDQRRAHKYVCDWTKPPSDSPPNTTRDRLLAISEKYTKVCECNT